MFFLPHFRGINKIIARTYILIGDDLNCFSYKSLRSGVRFSSLAMAIINDEEGWYAYFVRSDLYKAWPYEVATCPVFNWKGRKSIPLQGHQLYNVMGPKI